MDKIAIAMISDNNFIMPTCVAISSMISNKAVDSIYDIYVIMAECSEKSKEKISELSGDNVEIHLIMASLEEYREIKQLAHISIACLLKFDVCSMISQYDKILYLDGDIIVRGDLSELYNQDIDNHYAGAVKELACIEYDSGNINAGIMLFNAKRIREENLRDKLVKVRKGLGDRGSMDQQSFNIVTQKDYKFLPIKYNCIAAKIVGKEACKEYSIDQINRLYGTNYRKKKQVVDEALIIHFATSNKPWIYTFNGWAKEWHKYYLMSPFKNEEFELKGIWKYRLEKMGEAFKSDGFAGINKRIKDKLKRICCSKKDGVDWE